MASKKEILYQEFHNQLIKKYFLEDKIKVFFDDEMIEMFDIDILRIIFNVINVNGDGTLLSIFQNSDGILIKFCKTLDVMLKVLENHNVESSVVICNLFSDLKEEHLGVVSSFCDKYITDENIKKLNDDDIIPEFFIMFNYLVDRDVYRLNEGHPVLMKKLEDIEQVIKLHNDKENYSINILKNYKDKNINRSDYKEAYKEAYLYINYGLTLERANYIRRYFGQFLDSLETCIEESDREIFETLKAISSISKQATFSLEDLELMSKYTLKIYSSQNQRPSFIELSNYFKQMYLNAYNNSFFNTLNLEEQTNDETRPRYFGEVYGVPVYDSGTEFLMSVHSIARGNYLEDYYDDEGNNNKLYLSSTFKDDWQKLMDKKQKGFSTSVIGPSNMGTIGEDYILLGFNGYNEQTIVTMSQGDAYTSKSTVTAHFTDVKQEDILNYFIPPNKVEDESRYGYNEIFISDSKVPDYIVCFYKPETISRSNMAVVAAKSLGCPLICIDKEKIKNNEINKINNMENKLFDSDNLNPDLIGDILCRYMNLYTSTAGKRIMANPVNPNYDMIDEIKEFILKVDNKINIIEDDNMKVQWFNQLVEAYEDEVRKYNVARKIEPYFGSISTFILNVDRYINLSKYIAEKSNELTLKDTSNLKK